MKGKMKLIIALVALFALINSVNAQNNKQNIRGVVIDKLSQTTLPGATVQLLKGSESKGTSTDINGNYAITSVQCTGKHLFEQLFHA